MVLFSSCILYIIAQAFKGVLYFFFKVFLYSPTYPFSMLYNGKYIPLSIVLHSSFIPSSCMLLWMAVYFMKMDPVIGINKEEVDCDYFQENLNQQKEHQMVVLRVYNYLDNNVAAEK